MLVINGQLLSRGQPALGTLRAVGDET